MTDTELIIRGGTIVDPLSNRSSQGDLAIAGGRIVEQVSDSATVIDASGQIVCPAWIDVHVHLRQPGQDAKETLETGTAAAAAGGFAAVACMPNTNPPLDNPSVIAELIEWAARTSPVRVFPIATITRGRSGREAVDFDAVIEAGAIGWSDDGDTTADSMIMRRALEASERLDRPVIVHCEDKPLAVGAMHEGAVSRELGIAGIPAAAEEIIIARDLMLAELTGGWLHVCHVSTGRGIELIQHARERGVRVTAEVMTHHLVMSDEWVRGERVLHNTNETAGAPGIPGDPNTKVNPPLRPVSDTRSLLKALQEGWFDCFGTDHAPHAEPEKSLPYEQAAFGLSGLEFAFSLTWALVRAGHIDALEAVRRWTVEPARILRESPGSLDIGQPANVTIFDPEREWTVTRDSLKTRSKNTPLLGMTLRGRATHTIIGEGVAYHGE
jgi:dihydroorotase